MKNYDVFNKIIGYDDIKVTLKRVIDTINNQGKYKKLGCTIPKGLLLYGVPGSGKTTFAKEFLKLCNRNSFIVRKNKSDGDFIDYLNKVFEEARKKVPSIILLDDLDKFSVENNKSNNEEYVVIQSLIDEVKYEDIFVIATANDINILPRSLLRSGRFDIKLKLNEPKDEDSYNIIRYYLSSKKLFKDVNVKNISNILVGCSCADLEKICNQAGIYAGFQNKNEIHLKDLIRASLEFVYNTNIENIDIKDKYIANIAYHEAGHALIGELLEPNSVQFITTIKTNSNTKGMTIYHNNDNYWDDICFMENRVKTLLAGKASTEIVFNSCDTGCNSDLHRAFEITRRLVDNYCMLDFNCWIENYEETSEKIKQNKDERTNELISNYYKEVKNILIKNRKTLDSLAEELKNKKILFQNDIIEILNNN